MSNLIKFIELSAQDNSSFLITYVSLREDFKGNLPFSSVKFFFCFDCSYAAVVVVLVIVVAFAAAIPKFALHLSRLFRTFHSHFSRLFRCGKFAHLSLARYLLVLYTI